MRSQPGGFLQTRALRPSARAQRTGSPQRPRDCSHRYNSCIVCPAHGDSDETTTHWNALKHSEFFPQYVSFCLLPFPLSSHMAITTYGRDAHTMNTCRLAQPCSRMKSVHAQVVLAGSQVIIQLDRLRMLRRLKRPPLISWFA